MVLESTVVCVDNSDYMRNGDFVPSRLLAQQDAVNLVCHSKTRSNPENNVALITLSNNTEVLATLTSDVTKILSKLHQVKPKGDLNFMSGLRIAHLVLKHRQGKNHKMRIIVFIGSPIPDNDKELVKLAKRLRKEKVNVDIVNFGEEGLNTEKLTSFVNTINGTDGTSSRLVTVSPGPLLSDALISSPILAGEGGVGVGAGYEFGIDPNEDPELALALRVSMEEQRAQQEEAARRAGNVPIQETGGAGADTREESMLRQVLEMSRQDMDTVTKDAPVGTATVAKDFSAMTEDEQISYAMQMSLQTEMSMDTDSVDASEEPGNDNEEEAMMTDPEFLRGVLEGLPGVDLENQQVKNAMEQMKKNQDKNKKK